MIWQFTVTYWDLSWLLLGLSVACLSWLAFIICNLRMRKAIDGFPEGVQGCCTLGPILVGLGSFMGFGISLGLAFEIQIGEQTTDKLADFLFANENVVTVKEITERDVVVETDDGQRQALSHQRSLWRQHTVAE